MTFYELIMNGVSRFTKADWRALGRGEITDDDTIKQILMGGYAAVADED